MVVIAAAVCTKTGRALVSRQFIEMSKSRIEGLISAFHKHVESQNKQLTYFENQSVRYVYQSMEELYVFIITNRASNIVEDLETLQIITNIVSEYCGSINESNIMENAFELVFAFDEVIALGYKENVNMSQVKTFLEMDSQEEKLYQIAQLNKEREAEEEAKRRRKEIDRERRTREKLGLNPYSGMGSTSKRYSGQSLSSGRYERTQPSIEKKSAPTKAAPKNSVVTRKGLSLKSTAPKTNDYMEVLKQESGITGTDINDENDIVSTSPLREAVHLEISELVTAVLDKDGLNLKKFEVKGQMNVLVTNQNYKSVGFQLSQSHEDTVFRLNTNVDKGRFGDDKCLVLRDTKSYPVNTSNAVLKWIFSPEKKKISDLPLMITCWPNATSNKGDIEVSMEYEFRQDLNFELEDVVIKIPIVSKSEPNIAQIEEGETNFDVKNSVLEWIIPRIDKSNPRGAMTFEIELYSNNTSETNHLYPIQVSFSGTGSICGVSIERSFVNDEDVPFSSDSLLKVGQYEIE